MLRGSNQSQMKTSGNNNILCAVMWRLLVTVHVRLRSIIAAAAAAAADDDDDEDDDGDDCDDDDNDCLSNSTQSIIGQNIIITLTCPMSVRNANVM